MVRALVAHGPGADPAAALGEIDPREPGADQIVVEVEYSAINYKDALAVTGAPGLLRSVPLVPGVDAAGRVSRDAGGLKAGDAVVVTGAGLGERIDGGFAERLVAPVDAVVRVPEGFSTRDAAAIGTAGFTAALSVLALERRPLPSGPVLVTGAGGGVGGFAVALLASRGHEVVASTGRAAELEEHLRGLGATRIVGRLDAERGRPLQRAEWSAVVDTVGGGMLANAVSQTAVHGAVAACGLAADSALPLTVLPFILRGVDLLGIDSVGVERPMREAAWTLLSASVDAAVLTRMTDRIVPLDAVPAVAREVLAGRIRGRAVVDLRP